MTDRVAFDSRVMLVTVAAALITATTVLVGHRLSTGLSFSNQTKKQAPDDIDDGEEDDSEQSNKDSKRYDEVWERYDASTGEWRPENKDKDTESSHWFTIKHRTWPESYGQENYSVVAIRSDPVIEVLRRVMGRNVEEVNEEDVNVDGRDLWLSRGQLRAELERLEQQSAKLKVDSKPGDISQPSESTGASDRVHQAESCKKHESTTEPTTADPVTLSTSDDAEPSIPNARASLEDLEITVEHLSIMLDFLDNDLYRGVNSKLERLQQNGKLITYQLLWTQFPYESFAVAMHETSQEPRAFKVKTWNYHNTSDGPVFSLSGTVISWNGKNFSRLWIDVDLPQFKGMRNVTSLNAWPLDHRQREELTERGRRYKELAGVRFMEYTGVLTQTQGCGMNKKIIRYRASGRAVVDVALYRRLVPNNREFSERGYSDDDMAYEDWQDHSRDSGDYALSDEGPSEAELCLLPPTVFGFSLVVREWGEMLVTQFTEIDFNQTAWDQLVLDPQVKDLIRSLVESNTSLLRARAVEADGGDAKAVTTTLLQDIIQGKGGGLVFCSHGRAGVGKTLTAEAVAELGRAPLYSVTAGDLGNNAAALENKLRDLLDIAETWGAVLLIDEADVFLESRSLHDIGRNALVSVFLRMLERHSGVLFLTTNRLKSIDEAFLSRFSIGLKYDDLDKAKRRQIWAANLGRAGVGIQGSDSAGAVTQKALIDTARGTVTPGTSTPSTPVPEAPEALFSSYLKSQDLEKLASRSGQNGRTIKNTVRTAQALARSRNTDLSMKELEIVLKVGEEFLDSFKEPDEEGMYDAAGEGWKDRQNIYN